MNNPPERRSTQACHNPQVDTTFALFDDKRAKMERYLAPDAIGEREQKKALKYVNAFYEIVNNPNKKQRQVIEACVGS